MSLKIAFAAALQYIRTHRQLSQRAIAQQMDQSYVSRLESGTRSVTLEVSQELAEALKLEPLSLLTVVYAASTGKSPQQILDQVREDLAAAQLLDAQIPATPEPIVHPVVADAAALKIQVHALLAEGLTQAEAAKRLGISRQTVNKYARQGHT